MDNSPVHVIAEKRRYDSRFEQEQISTEKILINGKPIIGLSDEYFDLSSFKKPQKKLNKMRKENSLFEKDLEDLCKFLREVGFCGRK